MREWPGSLRLARVAVCRSMDAIKLFGLLIIFLKLPIREWPGGRKSGFVPDFLKIAFPQPIERCAIVLGLAANRPVGRVTGTRIEAGLCAGLRLGRGTTGSQKSSLLNDKDLQARLSEAKAKRSATRTRPDYDGIVT
ncbi:MAG TPA: hypothetical protein VMB73_06840 [Acetobacteraceae bacterium]|nr:hypothetical protein [Acetobacteraceae bacterium]